MKMHLDPELRAEVFDEEDGAFRVAVEDNGPGIVENQITRIFGKLCSRFIGRVS